MVIRPSICNYVKKSSAFSQIVDSFSRKNIITKTDDNLLNKKIRTMTKYKNLSGNSNVDSYEYTAETFTVKFSEGTHYLYSTQKNSLNAIQQMHQKADAGIGLGTMLATKPHHPHDSKW